MNKMIVIKVDDGEIPTLVFVETDGKHIYTVIEEIDDNVQVDAPVTIFVNKNFSDIHDLSDYCIENDIELVTQ